MPDSELPAPSDTAGRGSRWTSIGAAALFLCGMAWLSSAEWAAVFPLTIVALVGGALLGRRHAGAAGWIVLPFTYVSAVIVMMAAGHSRNGYQAPMLAAVLGTALASGVRRGWAVPARWRVALAWWALVATAGAAVVILRELDFTPALLWSNDRLAASGVGGTPAEVAVWVCYVAATLLTGVIWFDSFFARYGADGWDGFQREILHPLAVSMVACAAIAVYQGLVDINWLSGHGWGAQGRAGSGLIDGDAFGSLAGFWTGIFIALLMRGHWGWRLFAVAGFLLTWVGLWASGSRMALLAGVVSTAGAGMALLIGLARKRPWYAAGALAAMVLVAGAAASAELSWQTQSPLHRTIASLPEPNMESVKAFAEHQLWNRDAPFGTTFLWMVHDYPFTGVGPGSFNTLYPDYAYLIRGHYGAPENAQSWYRHQLAELGALGSAPVIWWLVLVAILLLHPRSGGDAAAGAFRAALFAVALVSAVSMPTQNAAVSLTVWPMIFGFVALAPHARARLRRRTAPPRRAAFVAIWCAALVFGAATAGFGWWKLRPPLRAVRANWTYTRGFEAIDSSGGQEFRWTRRHAIEVPHAPAAWMRVAIGGGPPDLSSRPMRVTIRRNGEPIIHYTLAHPQGETWWVRVPTGPPRIMIEIEVDRTWSPVDFGGTDPRQLGVAVLPFVFAPVPPRGANVVP